MSKPRQNRVTPFGTIVAVPERGLLMGNRGVLHDERQRLVRTWQVTRWIACRTEFRGRHREIMRPGSYTELFFLDEATAFAAGHRPCAECRHADYVRFKEAWAAWSGISSRQVRAEAIDRVLHAQRVQSLAPGRTRTDNRQRGSQADVGALPEGTMIELDGSAWLLWGDAIHEWSAAGYGSGQPRPASGHVVTVLTPPALVQVLKIGYPLIVHPSAMSPGAPIPSV